MISDSGRKHVIEKRTFKYVVLGGGKAGKTLAMDLGNRGLDVALIERGMFGGTCINVACIPTKTLVKSAKVAHEVHHANEFGIDIKDAQTDFTTVQKRQQSLVATLSDAHRNMFNDNPLVLFVGNAKFIGPHQIEVQTEDGIIEIVGEYIFINTGATPFIPDIKGLKESKPLTSDTILQLEKLPEHLLILGGSYIGLEFAQIFARLGSRVTVIELNSDFLSREDRNIASELKNILQNEGINFSLGIKTVNIEHDELEYQVYLENGEVLKGDQLLVAVGRKPATEDLNLEIANIQTEHGFVVVDDRLRTSAEGVWAMGDVKGGPQFTHLSLDDYRIICSQIFDNESQKGLPKDKAGREVPYVLFTDPPLGRYGLNKTQAEAQGRKVRIAEMPVNKVPAAKTRGEKVGLLSAVVDAETDKLLGVSLLCSGAEEMVSVAQLAILNEMTHQELGNIMFAHPTMSEAFNLLFDHFYE